MSGEFFSCQRKCICPIWLDKKNFSWLRKNSYSWKLLEVTLVLFMLCKMYLPDVSQNSFRWKLLEVISSCQRKCIFPIWSHENSFFMWWLIKTLPRQHTIVLLSAPLCWLTEAIILFPGWVVGGDRGGCPDGQKQTFSNYSDSPFKKFIPVLRADLFFIFQNVFSTWHLLMAVLQVRISPWNIIRTRTVHTLFKYLRTTISFYHLIHSTLRIRSKVVVMITSRSHHQKTKGKQNKFYVANNLSLLR